MLTPKKIAPSLDGKWWFECQYCFELFETPPNQVSLGEITSCGCRRQTRIEGGRTSEQKDRGSWLRKQIKKEKVANLPPLLMKLSKPRPIYLRWNPDLDQNASVNFLADTGDRPEGMCCGWIDPEGPIHPDNFIWKPQYASKSSRTSTATTPTGDGIQGSIDADPKGKQ